MPSKSRKSERGGKQKRFERLKRKLKLGPFHAEKIVVEPGGEVKISEVLVDFVEPYHELAGTEEAYRKLLTLAAMAWNASFLPEKEQQDMIEKVLDEGIPTGTEEMKTGLKEIIDMLMVRKKAHFSEYTRKIIDLEVTNTGKGYHLSVASSL